MLLQITSELVANDLMALDEPMAEPVVEPAIEITNSSNIPTEALPTVTNLQIPRKSRHRIPPRYHDILPTSLPSLPETPIYRNDQAERDHGATIPEVPGATVVLGQDLLETSPNIFGLFRRYRHCPSYDPDGEVTLDELASFFATTSSNESPDDALLLLPGPSTSHANEAFHPFPNMSTFLLSDWYYSSPSGERSAADFDRLISILSDKRFKPDDVVGFSARARDKLLDGINNSVNKDIEQTVKSVLGAWSCDVPVTIQIPEGKQWTNDEGRKFTVPGLHHRRITEVIQSVFQTNTHLHFTPFELWWQPPSNGPAQRIYSDIASSDAFYDAYREVNDSPDFQVAGCTLEKTVAAIMVYLDSTHLATFGTAKLWPIYAFASNLDKWFRLKPSTHSCEHWAYIPTVSN
jgi:hypothetical protein